MLGVVVVYELSHPGSCIGDLFEATWIVDPAFQGAVEAFDEWIVVAHARTRKRRRDPKLVEQLEDCSTLHRVAVIRVQEQPVESMTDFEFAEQVLGELDILLLLDLPSAPCISSRYRLLNPIDSLRHLR